MGGVCDPTRLVGRGTLLSVAEFDAHAGRSRVGSERCLFGKPGLDKLVWQAGIREFRELRIALGSDLQLRGNTNPDISSWLLAFSTWNQS